MEQFFFLFIYRDTYTFTPQILVARKLAWTTDYAIEKFLPLLSRWHLLHDENGEILHLDKIVKKRTLRGVLSYEVKWTDFDQNTVEPMSYLKLKYGKEINEFEAAKKKIKGELYRYRTRVIRISHQLYATRS